MNPSPWVLEGHSATLTLAGIEGRLDLLRPSDGLRITSQPSPLAGARLLAPNDPETPPSSGDVEGYVRGSDLVVTYARTAERPLARQFYWRAVDGASASGTAGGFALELIAATNTNLLDVWPGINVSSVLPASRVRVMLDDGSDFETIPPTGAAVEFGNSGYAGCFMINLPGSELTYVELVHPVDFHKSRIAHENDAAGLPGVRLVHDLFTHRLEKGVILKARLGAALVAQRDERQAARSLYRRLASSELPLTV